jgi:hypothetical protein
MEACQADDADDDDVDRNVAILENTASTSVSGVEPAVNDLIFIAINPVEPDVLRMIRLGTGGTISEMHSSQQQYEHSPDGATFAQITADTNETYLDLFSAAGEHIRRNTLVNREQYNEVDGQRERCNVRYHNGEIIFSKSSQNLTMILTYTNYNDFIATHVIRSDTTTGEKTLDVMIKDDMECLSVTLVRDNLIAILFYYRAGEGGVSTIGTVNSLGEVKNLKLELIGADISATFIGSEDTDYCLCLGPHLWIVDCAEGKLVHTLFLNGFGPFAARTACDIKMIVDKPCVLVVGWERAHPACEASIYSLPSMTLMLRTNVGVPVLRELDNSLHRIKVYFCEDGESFLVVLSLYTNEASTWGYVQAKIDTGSIIASGLIDTCMTDGLNVVQCKYSPTRVVLL